MSGAFLRRCNLCRVYTGHCGQRTKANAAFRRTGRSLPHTLCPLVSGVLLPLLSVRSVADAFCPLVNRLILATCDNDSWVQEAVQVGGGLLKLVKGCISTQILTLGLIIVCENLSLCCVGRLCPQPAPGENA